MICAKFMIFVLLALPGLINAGTQTVTIVMEKNFEVKCSSWRYKYATCSLENKINEVYYVQYAKYSGFEFGLLLLSVKK